MGGLCPNCGKYIDRDGFGEHGEEMLFYCECGRIYDHELVKIKKSDVDLSNLEGKYPGRDHCGNRGLFILKSRHKPTNRTK